MKKFTKIASVLFAMLIAAACLPGCSNANQSKEESKVSTPSTSVASIAQEESKEESSESSVESSKETSKEISTTSSEETSKEESKEVSKESSKETSKEGSKTSSEETSKEESKSTTSEVSVVSKVENTTSNSSTKPADDILKSFKSKYVDRSTIVAYGKCIKNTKLIGTSIDNGVEVPKDYCFGIIKTYDGYYEVFMNYTTALIDSSCIELFPDNYTPDESDPLWVSLKKFEDCF